MITVTTKVYFGRSQRGRKRIADRPSPSSMLPAGRTPRVSRVMAMAIHFEDLLRSGAVSDTVELAALAKVTQPRITQVMSLLHLAPDIQEEVLHLPPVLAGDDPIHEKRLRLVCRVIDFAGQRRAWQTLKRRAGCG